MFLLLSRVGISFSEIPSVCYVSIKRIPRLNSISFKQKIVPNQVKIRKKIKYWINCTNFNPILD